MSKLHFWSLLFGQNCRFGPYSFKNATVVPLLKFGLQIHTFDQCEMTKLPLPPSFIDKGYFIHLTLAKDQTCNLNFKMGTNDEFSNGYGPNLQLNQPT